MSVKNSINEHVSNNDPKDQNSSFNELTKIDAEKSSLLKAIKLLEKIEDTITNNSNLSTSLKIDTLKKISILFSKQAQSLIPKPTPAPILFKERLDKNQSGIEFVKEHFSDSLGISLTAKYLKKYDPTLYENIVKVKQRNKGKWPSDFPMLTQSEIVDKELNYYDKDALVEIERLGTNIRNRRKRGDL